MSFRLGAAALAASIFIALSSAAFPRGEWPNGPNKAWFETYKGRTITCIRIGKRTQVALLLR